MSEFLADPGGTRWKDPRFDQKLQKRLGISYDAYIGTMNELRKSIDEFNQRLRLDSNGKPKFSDETKFRKYYKSLNFSLKKMDYDGSMSSIRRANSSLHRMTSQTISLRNLQDSYMAERLPMPKFAIIHKHARGFHAALQVGWKCSCRAEHGAHLRLEHRIGNPVDDEESDEDETMEESFHVLFQYDHHESTDRNCSPSSAVGNVWSWKEADVHIALKEPSSTTSVAAKKGVRFARQTKPVTQVTLATTQNLELVHCLCTAISSLQEPRKSVYLSIVADQCTKIKHDITISSLRTVSLEGRDRGIRTLHNVLDDTPFSRRHRIQLAVTLASSVLQLHETAWLSDSWSSSDILFLDQSGRTLYTEPFVFQKHGVASPASQDALPPIMRYIIRNQVLYTLGISLIELWFKKPLSALHEPQDGPIGTGDAQTTLITQIATANRLIESDLRDDAGGNYADAVRRCISCDFDCRYKKLEDESFQKAVFEGVVMPIKETFDCMFRTTF